MVMSSYAFLTLVANYRFVKSHKYDGYAAFTLALGLARRRDRGLACLRVATRICQLAGGGRCDLYSVVNALRGDKKCRFELRFFEPKGLSQDFGSSLSGAFRSGITAINPADMMLVRLRKHKP